MKALTGIIIGIVALGAVATFTLRQNLPSGGQHARSSKAQAAAQGDSAGGAGAPSTRIEKLDDAGRQKAAEASVSALRKSHKTMEKSLDTTLNLSESEAAEMGDIASLQSAAAEKALLESLTSLTQQLIAEPGMTTSVIALLRDEQDPHLMGLIAQALGEAAQVLGKDFPHEMLIDMAMNDDNHARREAALIALSYMSEVPDTLRQQMIEIAQGGPNPQVRSMAIECLGQWMNRTPEMGTVVTAGLLAARDATNDPMVRGMVIQTIGNSNQPLTDTTLAAMGDALQHESMAGNRSLAAVALGSGATPENRPQVIAQLESAYQNEASLDTRRHIITQIVKAARADAATYLQRLDTPHALLQQDVADYMDIMAGSNPSDWGAIWEQKSHRDSVRGTYPSSHGGHGHDETL